MGPRCSFLLGVRSRCLGNTLRTPPEAAWPVMRLTPLGVDVKELRRDVREGRVSVDQLLDLIEQLQNTGQGLRREVQCLQEKLAAYESETRSGTAGPSDAETQSTTAASTESYSLDAEARRRRRRRRRRRKKSSGRTPTELKFAEAERIDEIYPDNVRHADCHVVRERAVWRLEDGRAVRVGYRIFAGPDGKEPRIPGVTPRCEHGLEILIVLAFLVYIIGISLDKACAVLRFFCQLPLAKSQADALLRQLARHWESEFDALCELIAHAAVVYMDETGWKVGDVGCSLWAFATDWQRLFIFGCRKDDATLDKILPPDVFDGVGVSDDYSVYRDRFRVAQKCWAHLLRKLIRLALLYPRRKRYQRLLDELLTLYGDAKRIAADQRLGDELRKLRICDLENRLYDLCRPHAGGPTPAMTPHEKDFANLVEEFRRLNAAGELFTFVLIPGVDPTNNLSERLLRGPAQDRKAGRTNRNEKGARRRSVIVSVLESLRVNLETFNLATVLQEVGRWMTEGISLFQQQWQTLKARLEAATVTAPNTG
jgi:Transposase IS66 family.